MLTQFFIAALSARAFDGNKSQLNACDQSTMRKKMAVATRFTPPTTRQIFLYFSTTCGVLLQKGRTTFPALTASVNSSHVSLRRCFNIHMSKASKSGIITPIQVAPQRRKNIALVRSRLSNTSYGLSPKNFEGMIRAANTTGVRTTPNPITVRN